jgi:hypothetical protein
VSPDFQPASILDVLVRNHVRFVIVGGLAAVARGSPYVTSDIDITPEHSAANLQRLCDALSELQARVWSPDIPEGLALGHDATSLGGVGVWNLITEFGRCHISVIPSGTQGYDDLHRDATVEDFLGIEVEVASLADVIRSKEAAGRVKDLLVLPDLRRLLEEG